MFIFTWLVLPSEFVLYDFKGGFFFLFFLFFFFLFLLAIDNQRITNSPVADVFVVWAKDETGVIRGFVLEKVGHPHCFAFIFFLPCVASLDFFHS